MSEIPYSVRASRTITPVTPDKVIFAVRGTGTQLNMTSVITGWRTPVINVYSSQWNSSSGIYTINETGTYRIVARSVFSGQLDERSLDFNLRKNGSTYIYWSGIALTSPPGQPEYYTGTIDIIDSFNQNDTLSLNGNASTMTFNLDQTFFNITRIY